MRIGILITGPSPETLEPEYGTYADMFERFLGGRGLTFDRWAVHEGEMPPAPEACDGWLVTGSKHGVYDDLPWIAPLMGFLRAVQASGLPMVGICFGHQIIAHALGGRAEKFAGGWAVGLTEYATPTGPRTLYGYHQDQVVDLPPGAEVIASTAFCPMAGLRYGSQILTYQPHPEFDAAFVRGLLESRAVGVVPDDVRLPALAGLDGPNDNARIAAELADFLLAGHKARAA